MLLRMGGRHKSVGRLAIGKRETGGGTRDFRRLLGIQALGEDIWIDFCFCLGIRILHVAVLVLVESVHRRQSGSRIEVAHLGVRLQLGLQVADVVDDVLDDLQLGELPVLGHERNEVLQFGQIHLHLGILPVAAVRGMALDAPAGIQGRHSGGTCLADGRQGLHSGDDCFTLLE